MKLVDKDTKTEYRRLLAIVVLGLTKLRPEIHLSVFQTHIYLWVKLINFIPERNSFQVDIGAFTYTVVYNINIVHIASVAQPGIVSINRQERCHMNK